MPLFHRHTGSSGCSTSRAIPCSTARDPGQDAAFAFGGVAGDIPTAGDWNGDGRAKVGVYRPVNGLFVLDYNGDRVFDAAVDKAYNLGVGIVAGDRPVVGDWNGDGRTKVGLFRDGFFWILDTNGNGVFQTGVDNAFAYGGIADDRPVVGDWPVANGNGNGKGRAGIFRLGFLWILDNGDNALAVPPDAQFTYGGITGDVPVTGDWRPTAGASAKAGVFRFGYFWVLDASGNGTFDGTGPNQDLAFAFGGVAGDKPVVGRW